MKQFLCDFGDTSGNSSTFSDVATGTVTPVGKVALLMGEARAISGEDQLKKMEKAIVVLNDRVRNVARNAVACRVEVYNDDSEATFLNTAGLTSEDFVAAAYNVADADTAQGTELLNGSLLALLIFARETLYTGVLAPLYP